MYIGDTGERGLHRWFTKSLTTVLTRPAGCSPHRVVNFDNSITVSDDGRGIPVDMHRLRRSLPVKWR